MNGSARKRILVLGAGMIGEAIARDLAADSQVVVTVADRDSAALDRIGAVAHGQLDLSRPEVVRAEAAKHDLVVGALPSSLGWSAMNAVIDAGRDYCDVSFMRENPLEADARARARGATVLIDCGVAPGLTNLLVGHAVSGLARCERVSIYVGGLPQRRVWPFNYKAGFSPRDVLEEYLRPVRLVEAGQVVEKEALSDIELLEFDGVGQLEAFNTDGLRTLIYTIEAEELSEKTLRYPGHAELMRVLRHVGLFDTDPITLAGDPSQQIKPMDLTTALLFPHWRFEPGEGDLTVMRVEVEGQGTARREQYRWNMLDRYDPKSDTRSMSRVTAYTCTALTRLLIEGKLRRPGVTPPETVGRDATLFDDVLRQLRQRGVDVSPA